MSEKIKCISCAFCVPEASGKGLCWWTTPDKRVPLNTLVERNCKGYKLAAMHNARAREDFKP